MWISKAYAHSMTDAVTGMADTAMAAGAPTSGDFFSSMLPFVIILFVFWLFILRPQQKRVKTHVNMVNNLRKGDKIVTGGGIVGKIAKAPEGDEVLVEIADGVKIKVLKSTLLTSMMHHAEDVGAKSPESDDPKSSETTSKKDKDKKDKASKTA